jgi:ABC-type polysaccharide/polyol phosphate export permease
MKNYLSVVAIAFNEDPYINEFIHYYRLLGVDHFYFYDNGSTVPLSATIKQHAAYCTVIDFPGKARQMEAYKHYKNTYGKDTRWAAFLDLDEYIVPKTTYKLSDFLKQYEHADALAVNWVMFGHNGHEKKPAGLITENFTRSEGVSNLHIKTIANPQKVVSFADPHHFIMHEGSVYIDAKNNPVTGAYHEPDTKDLIQLNHYFTKSLEEFEAKINRGRAAVDGKRKAEEAYRGAFRIMWNSQEDHALVNKYLKDLKQSIEGTNDVGNASATNRVIQKDRRAAFQLSNRMERLWLLAKIEFKLRYYENKLGLFWAVIKPLMDLTIYYIVFKTILKHDTPHFASYLFIGLIFYNFFLESTTGTIQILRTKKYLYEYTNMNKIEIYLSTLFSNSIGLFFNMMVFTLFFLVFEPGDTFMTWRALYIIPLYINIFTVSLGFSLLLSNIYIFAKDIHQIWMVFTNFFLFVSPIFYKLSTFRNSIPGADYVNPFAGIVINARRVTMYNQDPEWDLMLFDFGYAVLILLIGIIFLRRLGSMAAEKL